MQIIRKILIYFFLLFFQIHYKLDAAIRSITTAPTIQSPTESNASTPTTNSHVATATTSSNTTTPASATSIPVQEKNETNQTSTTLQQDTAPSTLPAPTFIAITPTTAQAPIAQSTPDPVTTTSISTPIPTPTTTTTATSTTIPTTTQVPSSTPTQSTPTPPGPIEKFLTSIYIQNNYSKKAILHQIDFLVDNQINPLIKSNLNITIPAVKNIYSKGSIIGFDITSPGKIINNFNGVASITIDNDVINFSNIKTGYGIGHPIKITQKNGHWVSDDI